jgi:hypothetical protein
MRRCLGVEVKFESPLRSFAEEEENLSAKKYLDRGRKLSTLTELQLRDEFISAVKAFAAAASEASRTRCDEVILEYRLREAEVPYLLAVDDIAAILLRSKRRFNRLLNER